MLKKNRGHCKAVQWIKKKIFQVKTRSRPSFCRHFPSLRSSFSSPCLKLSSKPHKAPIHMQLLSAQPKWTRLCQSMHISPSGMVNYESSKRMQTNRVLKCCILLMFAIKSQTCAFSHSLGPLFLIACVWVSCSTPSLRRRSFLVFNLRCALMSFFVVLPSRKLHIDNRTWCFKWNESEKCLWKPFRRWMQWNCAIFLSE